MRMWRNNILSHFFIQNYVRKDVTIITEASFNERGF